ncbi:inward rectifier potassium channel 2-like [Dreissena polymorpha]|uniref:inward rectifier potassium channel 2-like n=1 Tax=Dreissena polymorpha TaxID=45954 RepID=UPI0022648540|nr:inward rectifier potassium channel 2-like [Dreissena polymorpha]
MVVRFHLSKQLSNREFESFYNLMYKHVLLQSKSCNTASKRDAKSAPSRLVNRDGKLQICLDQLSLDTRRRYLKNPFNTVLDLKWRWTIVIFSVGFISTWLFFAIVYYLLALIHGDLSGDRKENEIPCLQNVKSFSSAFLFSLETQHTIGYGYRNPSSECSGAVFVVYIQFIVGIAVQCVTAGIIVAKLQTGKRTHNAIMFSELACVGICNNSVCLMVRIGNAGPSELVNVKGSGVIIERLKLEESGDSNTEALSETVVEFVSDSGSSNINLLWPAVIHCQIKENAKQMIKRLQSVRTELIVVLEGVFDSTGRNVQLRRSFLPHEIEIGKQFVDISPQLVKNQQTNAYCHTVDIDGFDAIQTDKLWERLISSSGND